MDGEGFQILDEVARLLGIPARSEPVPLYREPDLLRRALSPRRVLILGRISKEEALRTLIGRLAAAPEVANREILAREIFRREGLMSTGIGSGIGVPHVRLGSISNTVAAVGISRAGIAGYESLDGQKVNIVCMIASGENQHELYLKILALVCARLRNSFFRRLLMEATKPRTAYRLLTAPGYRW